MENSTNGTELIIKVEIDGPLPETLFDINFPLATGYVAIVLVLSVFGILGNSFILYVMKYEKSMNDHAKYFIVNIAIADLCVSGIADPMCIVGAFIGMQYLNSSVIMCVIIASMCLTACICVFLNLVSLTVNRWMFICHNQIYDKFYTNTSTKVMCVLCWVVGFGAECPSFFGWGGHYFDEKSHQCVWDRTASRSYTLFVSLGLITAPFGLLAACNLAIFRKIYIVKRNITAFNASKKDTFLKSVSSAKTLLVMFFVFLVCWMPYVIVLVLDHSNTFSMETHLFVILLAHSHSSTSCFIYLAFKKKFRDQLALLFVFKNRIQPVSSEYTPKNSSLLNGQTKTTIASNVTASPPLSRLTVNTKIESNHISSISGLT